MAFKTVRMPGLVEVADPGHNGRIDVPDHHNMVCILTSAGVEARNIPIPTFVGQVCVLSVDAHGGNIVVNVAGNGNVANADEITFTAASQTARMVGVKLAGALRWRRSQPDRAPDRRRAGRRRPPLAPDHDRPCRPPGVIGG